MSTISRRQALRGMAGGLAGLAGLSAVKATTAVHTPAVPAPAVIEGYVLSCRTFRGTDDPSLVSALDARMVGFYACQFLDCGPLEFGPGRDVFFQSCRFHDTRLVFDDARFTIARCEFLATCDLGSIVKIGNGIVMPGFHISSAVIMRDWPGVGDYRCRASVERMIG